MNKRGEPKKDKLGLFLYYSLRGTNLTEAYHKGLVTTFGTWRAGIQISDAVLIERNHRYNHRVAEKKRCNFPIIGHYDTWLIDLLQIVIHENHGVHLFCDWSNSLDFIQTKESFGTVALHTSELHNLLTNVDVSENLILSKDQEYIGQLKLHILFLITQ